MAEDKTRGPMKNRPVAERVKDFEEVPLGYSVEEALAEARRCLQCKDPKCVKGCPVGIDIPAFIKLIASGKRDLALAKIKESNSLPAVCGRVCPQEEQCELKCILNAKKAPIAIGSLERFAAEGEEKQPSPPVPLSQRVRGKKVAVIGSGPAGLTCAGDLAKLGYQVTVFESLHVIGGVLQYGIPEFRLPKKIVDLEVEYVKSLGVQIVSDHLVDDLNELLNDYQAVFIGSGAGLPNFLGIPGENLPGVYSANEFLFRVNMMKAYKFPEYLTPVKIGKRVAVIGAGNVAMDSARVSLRLGAEEALIVYRRSRGEMPARREEIVRCEEEGVKFHLLTAPIALNPDQSGWVKEMECEKMELGEPDQSGRRRPIAVPQSEFKLPIDTVIVAIGNSPNPLIPHRNQELRVNERGGVIINDAQSTSLPGVFAGGDIVRGSATVIS
ncbi:MAG: NADPH-dependent glutamate synthase, partial [Candidatus Margulisbacteria bacterium]|nr:NADPH-dependent glutamate synthase [Candidatus Margulisiibacteriota bacterium]